MANHFTAQFFSPRSLVRGKYQCSDGSGIASLELAHFHQSEGITLLSAPHEVEAWLYGAVPANLRTDAFEYSARLGNVAAIETFLNTNPPPFSLVPFDPFVPPPETLFSLLMLEAPVVAALRESDYRRCHRCKGRVPLYDSLAKLLQALQLSVATPLQRLLISGRDEVAYLASHTGYREVPSLIPGSDRDNENLRWFILDEVDPNSLGHLASILRPLWNLPSSAVWLESSISRIAFSRFGTCPSCGQNGAPGPAPHESTTQLLTNDYSGRLIGDVEYRELISVPIREIGFHCDSQSPIFKTLAQLKTLGCDNLPLSSQLDTASSDFIRLARAGALLAQAPHHVPLVLTFPFSMLHLPSAQRLRKVLDHRAKTQTMLLLDEWQESVSSASTTVDAEVETLYLSRKDNNEVVISFVSSSQILADSGRLLPLTVPTPSERALLVEWLGIYDLLSQLFAASVTARMSGLTSKDFRRLINTKPNRHTCSVCLGLGFETSNLEMGARLPYTYPSALCRECGGARFGSSLQHARIKGHSLGEVLNSSFEEQKSLLLSLHRGSQLFQALEELQLLSMPIGIPLPFVSPSEVHRLSFVRALRLAPNPLRLTGGRAGPPTIITGDLYRATLSNEHLRQVVSLIKRNTKTDLHWCITTDSQTAKLIQKSFG